MKNKILIFVSILVSFLFIDKVSAAKLKYNYNSSDFEILNEYKYIIDDIISYANENNSNNYTYFIYLVKSSGNYYLCFGLGNYTSSILKFQPYYYTGSPRYYYNGANQILVLNNDDYSVIGTPYSNNVSFNLSDFNSEDYDTFINTVHNYILNGATSYSHLSNQVATTPVNVDYFSNSYYLLPVYSSSKLQYYQAYSQYTDTITIGDITYNYGDYIPTYYEYFELNNSTYKYDDLIHDYNIAQTYFTLDLEQLQKNDYNIDISYAYGNQTSSDIVDAYLKITYSDNTNAYFSMNTNDNPIVNVFMGSYQSCLDTSKGIINVQVVFPMESTQDVDYKIQLESNINFDISYLYDEEYITNLTTIDLTGKYGILLIPKVKMENEIFQDFYLKGDFEIRGIDDIDNINNSIVSMTTDYFNNYFRYITDYRYNTVALQFVNNNYIRKPNELHTITFDNRYFTYSIFETEKSIIQIENPNTGITNNINADDINYQMFYGNISGDLSSLYENVDSFYDEHGNAQILLSLTIKEFFDTCPNEIEKLIFVCLLLSICGCLIAVLGWR